MREPLLAVRIIDEVKRSAKRYQRSKGDVRGFVLEVGELAAVDPQILEQHLRSMTPLSVTLRPGEGKISCSCGFIGRPRVLQRDSAGIYFNCPDCADIPKIVAGNTILLRELQFS